MEVNEKKRDFGIEFIKLSPMNSSLPSLTTFDVHIRQTRKQKEFIKVLPAKPSTFLFFLLS